MSLRSAINSAKSGGSNSAFPPQTPIGTRPSPVAPSPKVPSPKVQSSHPQSTSAGSPPPPAPPKRDDFEIIAYMLLMRGTYLIKIYVRG